MRVLVCGGRDYDDKNIVYRVLYDFCDKHGLWTEPDEYGNRLPTGLVIIHGGAKGADRLADAWAVVNWVPFEEYKADWDKYRKAAGPIRNQEMLDTGIDVVIAFPGGKGTEHMKRIARARGVEVIEIP